MLYVWPPRPALEAFISWGNPGSRRGEIWARPQVRCRFGFPCTINLKGVGIQAGDQAQILSDCGVPEDNTRYLVENYVPSDQITYVGVFVKWHKAKQPTLLPDDWPRYLALQSAARFPPGDLPLGLLPASADESSGVGGTITPGLCNIRRIQQCSTAQPVETHNVAVY